MGKGITGEHEHRLAQIKEDTIFVVWKWDEWDVGGVWEWGEEENGYTEFFPDYDWQEENSFYNDPDVTDEELIEAVRDFVSDTAEVVILR